MIFLIQYWGPTLNKLTELQIKQIFILIKDMVFIQLFLAFLLKKIVSYFENPVLKVEMATDISE